MSTLEPYPLPAASKILFWAPRSDSDDEDSLSLCPPSPTSSLKACFVRSRPTTLVLGSQSDLSVLDFSHFALPPESESSSSGSASCRTDSPQSSSADSHHTGMNSDNNESANPSNEADPFAVGLGEALYRLNRDRRRRYNRREQDAHSTFTSASKYTLTPLRILRQSDPGVVPCTPTTLSHSSASSCAVVQEDIIIVDKQGSGKNLIWKGLRKGVSRLTRKGGVSSKPQGDVAATPAHPKEGGLKPSSASIFTIKRRGTMRSTPSTTTHTPRRRRTLVKKRKNQTMLSPAAKEARAALRRSRSLSSFRITPETFFVDYSYEEMDEDTAEAAADIAAIVGQAWSFEAY